VIPLGPLLNRGGRGKERKEGAIKRDKEKEGKRRKGRPLVHISEICGVCWKIGTSCTAYFFLLTTPLQYSKKTYYNFCCILLLTCKFR